MSNLWSMALLDAVTLAVADDPDWQRRLNTVRRGLGQVHLAILTEPYLRYILEGVKTIESRFAKKPIEPYRSVSEGDVVILKRSSGPVAGICVVSSVWFYQLDDEVRRDIRDRYSKPLCATAAEFWEQRRDKRYATLMGIEHVRDLPNLLCGKRDRRGWVRLPIDHTAEMFA